MFIVTFFTLMPFTVKAKDCSEFKLLSHKWNMCKADISALWDKDNSSDSKKQSKGSGFFKNTLNKIKNFGGKNVGEKD